MMSSTIVVVKLPFRDDLASAFPPFKCSCEKFQGSKTAEESLGCFAQLDSLPRPQRNSTAPLGNGGAALDSCLNFRVMMPLHQKQHLEIPE